MNHSDILETNRLGLPDPMFKVSLVRDLLAAMAQSREASGEQNGVTGVIRPS